MTLDLVLGRLQDAQLLRRIDEAAPGSSVSFAFKHALVQDTAYGSLLKQERKRLHFAIGRTLEETNTDRADELAGELARHFSEAGDDEKTFVYAERAESIRNRELFVSQSAVQAVLSVPKDKTTA